MTAIEQVLAAGVLPPDLGGRATTAEITEAVAAAAAGVNQ
jgi:tartrate dehydrogenase/decarboxylase/D-malate dehydrogenase